MRNSRISLAICAVLGSAFITACQPTRFGCLRDAEFGSFHSREFPELVGRQPVGRPGRLLKLGRVIQLGRVHSVSNPFPV